MYMIPCVRHFDARLCLTWTSYRSSHYKSYDSGRGKLMTAKWQSERRDAMLPWRHLSEALILILSLRSGSDSIARLYSAWQAWCCLLWLGLIYMGKMRKGNYCDSVICSDKSADWAQVGDLGKKIPLGISVKRFPLKKNTSCSFETWRCIKLLSIERFLKSTLIL